MHTLQTLTAAPNSSLLPDHSLSPPRLLEWAEAETEASENFLRTIAHASQHLPESARQSMWNRAVDSLKSSPIVFGSPEFDAWALSASAAPFLLWLSLRIRQPRITRSAAAEFLKSENADQIIHTVWDLWGFSDTKNSPAPPSTHPIGGASSANSTAAASAPPAPPE